MDDAAVLSERPPAHGFWYKFNSCKEHDGVDKKSWERSKIQYDYQTSPNIAGIIVSFFYCTTGILLPVPAIHNPDIVPFAANILTRWEGEETKLWESLKEKYKEDPDHLFPFKSDPNLREHWVVKT